MPKAIHFINPKIVPRKLNQSTLQYWNCYELKMVNSIENGFCVALLLWTAGSAGNALCTEASCFLGAIGPLHSGVSVVRELLSTRIPVVGYQPLILLLFRDH